MSIGVQGVSKRFGEFQALDDVSIEVKPGTLLALLGPSGSGKTTLLRIISGLESPDSGRVYYQGEDVSSLGARERQVGFVFQHYALFRHMNVFENVAFGMRVRRESSYRIATRVRELLHLVRLEGLERRYPSQLSGGQRQRVALARALAIQPRVLLLDEPFGALDAKVREELRTWLRQLHDEIHMTSVFVTHDQEEAFEVADEVVVMNRGKVEQQGRPDDVFERPATPFVMDFLGHVNMFHGRVEKGQAWFGAMAFDCPEHLHEESRPATVYVRPHEFDIETHPNGRPTLRASVERINATGSVAKVRLVAEGLGLGIHVDLSPERYRELQLRTGDLVYVSPRQVRVFPADQRQWEPEYAI